MCSAGASIASDGSDESAGPTISTNSLLPIEGITSLFDAVFNFTTGNLNSRRCGSLQQHKEHKLCVTLSADQSTHAGEVIFSIGSDNHKGGRAATSELPLDGYSF